MTTAGNKSTSAVGPFEPVRLSQLSRHAAYVARHILGAYLVRGDVVLRITETEAYGWPDDSACHANRGQTPRNRIMFGKAGLAYIYLCYGIHNLLNVVCGKEGEGAAVLIRSADVVSGQKTVLNRRKGKSGRDLLAGPGKVGEALGLDTEWSGHNLLTSGELQLCKGTRPKRIGTGTRIGIGYADDRDQSRLWRFADLDATCVSYRKQLKEINESREV